MYYKKRLKNIKAMLFDVDGVFSNSIFVGEDGILNRTMNAKDGFAVRYAVEQGYIIGIITGGTSDSVKIRFQNIGVTDIYLGQRHKIDAYEDFLMKYGLEHENISYMGDDLPDYEIMTLVGPATCPADAAIEIKEVAHYISDKAGGNGCVRDIIEQVMKIHEKWKV